MCYMYGHSYDSWVSSFFCFYIYMQKYIHMGIATVIIVTKYKHQHVHAYNIRKQSRDTCMICRSCASRLCVEVVSSTLHAYIRELICLRLI